MRYLVWVLLSLLSSCVFFQEALTPKRLAQVFGAGSVYHLSREEVEHDLANTYWPLEDVFVYGDGTCFDIGFNEEPDHVCVDIDRFQALVHELRDSVIYEYHPHSTLPEERISPPSLTDLLSFQNTQKICAAAGKQLVSRAVGYGGMYTYAAGDAFKAEYTGYNDLASSYLASPEDPAFAWNVFIHDAERLDVHIAFQEIPLDQEHFEQSLVALDPH